MANPVLQALVERARTRGSDPAVTFLTTAGERTELSGATLLNTVAKAANLLREEFDVEPGTPVCLSVPWHWQRAPWLIACLSLGALVHTDRDTAVDAGAVVEVGSVASLEGSPLRDRLAVSLHPFGLPIADLPDGLVDAAAEARLQPDAFLGEDADTADWLRACVERGASWTSADRVLAAGDCGWAVLLTPLATPAALVMTETPDASRARGEGVTAHW